VDLEADRRDEGKEAGKEPAEAQAAGPVVGEEPA